jgi:aminoglycoside N3'-acetyltransferase
MGILTVTREQVIASLKATGIAPGDGLMVHSALQFLGRPAGGAGMYLTALQSVIGNSGTVVVPTFNFDFCHGAPFDPDQTPSKGMGAFSEWVRRCPDAHRSHHPMQSVAAIGRYAEDLAGRDTPSAFDDQSPFDRMLALDFKLLLLGAEIQAVSMVHYSEQRAHVPYRYWKDFSGKVKIDKHWEDRTYRMFVRYMSIETQLKLSPIQDVLQAEGKWAFAAFNYGQVSLCRLTDLVSAADRLLSNDPWALIGNRDEAMARYIAKTQT